MSNEYIIINKSLLVDKIRELKEEREEHEKVDIGMFDPIWAAKTTQAVAFYQQPNLFSTLEGISNYNHKVKQKIHSQYFHDSS